ncbi:MAG: TonB-dependent receptor [Candidatus Azobacteroides sp.]|nr:TonB-dependent receptor [Candidatus Azobacteroides sp.]
MLLLSHTLFSQITVDIKDKPIKEVLKEIESKSSFKFFYNSDLNELNKNVSLKVTNSDIDSALNQLFAGSGIGYQKQDNIILLIPKKAGATQEGQKKITGVVKDEKGETVIGASVAVKGASIGTVTDADGKFSLDVPQNATLTVSFIGFLTKEINVGDKTALDIILEENTRTLDEVVVVGYGTMKKRDLTGAVSSVKMSDNPVTTVSSVSQVLAGKAAGFQVSAVSAQPGGGSSYRIRGAASPVAGQNDPLIIIDGFPVASISESDADRDSGGIANGKYYAGTTDDVFSSINPNDIESIEILKDASSSAIYGARAGNGVIIITTKRGKTGVPVVRYSGTATVQAMAKKYETLNAREFMTESNRYYKEAWMRDNGIAPYGNTPESGVTPFSPRYADALIANPPYDTDWFGAVTRTGFQTQHNINVSGGTESTQYLISGNFFNQNGVVKENGLSRYSGRLNLDQKLSKYFKTGVNFTFSRNSYDNVPLGSYQNEEAGILVAAAQFNPILPIKDENGDYVLNTEAAYLPNPVSLLEITDKTVKERLLATVYLEYEPIKDLKLKGNFGIDRNYQKRKTYLPKTTLYGQKKGGQADISQNDKSDYLMELTANYTKAFGDHNLNALVGYSYQQFDFEGVNLENNQFLIDGFLFNNIGAGAAPKPTVGSTATKDEMASFFGRINYSYKGNYLLTFTLRADGASNFAKDHRWGYFPSVSAGWRFIDENFMSSLRPAMSNGKLRVSYGQTGRSNIGNRTISYYQVGNSNTFGDSESQGVYLQQLGNPDLKWETTGEWNFGLDLGFVNNRFNITGEYFNRVISDLLNQRSLQSYNEVNTIWANIGKTQSRGFELTINTQNIQSKNFNWSSDFTFSFYRDKWKERDPYWKPAAYDLYNAPLRGHYGYLSDGIIQAGETVPWMPGSIPGQVKLKDINGFVYNPDGSVVVDERGFPRKTGQPDGKLDDADKVFYGSDDPGYLMGFNNTVHWKKFDLNVYFYGQFDKPNYGSYRDLWLTGASGMTGIINMYRGYNMPVTAQEVWTHDNQTAWRPGYFQNNSTYGIGDLFKQDAWFIRCRNITFGYTFQMPQTKKVFSTMRIYADINNPFVITPYKGLDPETDNSVWAYPNIRSYSIGLDITF